MLPIWHFLAMSRGIWLYHILSQTLWCVYLGVLFKSPFKIHPRMYTSDHICTCTFKNVAYYHHLASFQQCCPIVAEILSIAAAQITVNFSRSINNSTSEHQPANARTTSTFPAALGTTERTVRSTRLGKGGQWMHFVNITNNTILITDYHRLRICVKCVL